LLDHSENFGRDAAIAALDAVGGFSIVRGANGRMMRPLQLLLEALTELGRETSDGRIYVPEMLDPHPLDEDGKPKSKRSRSHKKRKLNDILLPA
jgi:hypothetical protein